MAIERGATTLHAVAPTEVLQAGDVLWFAGSTDGVITLRKIPGDPLLPVWLHCQLESCMNLALDMDAQGADCGWTCPHGDVMCCGAGLAQVDDQIGKLTSHVLDRRLVQVVMARTSDLLGKSVRETRFRRRFDAAIIALHREGHRIRQKIGDITLAVCCPTCPYNSNHHNTAM